MSREVLEELLERWMDDASFRTAVRQDPEEALRATGLELDENEWAAIRALDWSLSDEELSPRVSKIWACACGTLGTS